MSTTNIFYPNLEVIILDFPIKYDNCVIFLVKWVALNMLSTNE